VNRGLQPGLAAVDRLTDELEEFGNVAGDHTAPFAGRPGRSSFVRMPIPAWWGCRPVRSDAREGGAARGARQAHARPSQSVQRRGRDLPAVAAEVGVSHVVGDDEHD
jgi:hypothetical protein